ncbi:MAG: MBOAT family O-acyltransferase [Leptospirillia bacterium]
MVFSSPIFLFLFLPVVLAIYVAVPKAAKNGALLFLSLLFYAWGEGVFVLVMLASIAANYICGLLIEKRRGTPSAKTVLAVGVALNLGLLGVFKYAGFLLENLNAALGQIGTAPLEMDPVHLPIGISFFTFQAMSYVVDVYRGDAPARHNPLQVGLYIAMFPQLIAGPIIRYQTVARQIVDRTVDLDGFADGVRRFIIGLMKKVLLANPLGEAADGIFALNSGDLTTPLAWLGIGCYTLQIYFDFSGYSDMAIGLGRMFGFRFPENFNYPYISGSVREFWRRWHISLSSWFRDYLYIPLGGNRMGPTRTHLNLLTVFFLCGLWHGASWNFVIWGLMHGAFLVTERGRFGRVIDRLWRPLRHAYLLLVVMVGWVFFRAETLPEALAYLSAMAGFGAGDGLTYHTGLFLTNQVTVCLSIGLLAATPVLPLACRVFGGLPGWRAQALSGSSVILLLLGLVLCGANLVSGTYNPFIYFRF